MSAPNITEISLQNKHGPFDQSISRLVEQKEEQIDRDETVLDVFLGKVQNTIEDLRKGL